MTKPVRDRSGRGLPPKAERRAAGKLAAARRRRRQQRIRLLRIIGTAVATVAAVAAVPVACVTLGSDDGSAPASPGASAETTPSATAGPSLDPALSTKPAVTAGAGQLNQLAVTTLVEGTGAPVRAGQRLAVQYVGVSYTTGEEFDSSWKTRTPFELTLGAGEVIAGWDQGLLGVKVGSRVQLDIPTDLAYGPEAAAQDRPAGPLRFVVDVVAAT